MYWIEQGLSHREASSFHVQLCNRDVGQPEIICRGSTRMHRTRKAQRRRGDAETVRGHFGGSLHYLSKMSL